MLDFICFVSLLINIQSISSSSSSDDSLYFVFEHFRHGARTPWKNLSKNYTDILGQQWPGFGELTQIGIIQLYLLGVHTKSKYKDFISSSYDPKEVLVYSTNVNRSIASAQVHIAGMFSQLNETSASASPLLSSPATMKDKLIPPMNINDLFIDSNYSFLPVPVPVPIHTYDERKQWGHDSYLFQTFTYDKPSNCPGVIPIRKANLKLPIVTDYIHNFTFNYSSFFKEEYSINTLNYSTINDICDAFICGYYDNKDLTKFISKGIPPSAFLDSCFELNHIKQFHISQGGKAAFTGVMTMSSTMLQIINWMDKRIGINDNNHSAYLSPKFVIYSGHDSTIASIASFLKKAFDCNYEDTPFGTSQFLELHKREGGDFWVEYYYNGALRLNITYAEFKDRVTKTAWKEERVDDFCYIPTIKDRLILSLTLLLIASLVIAISLLLYCSRNKLSQRDFIKVIETKDDESPNASASTS